MELKTEQDIEIKVHDLQKTATTIAVVDEASYLKAAEFYKQCRQAEKDIVGWFEDMKKKAHATWKGIVAKESAALAPITAAASTVNQNMNRYLTEEKRKQEAEQKRLQAIEEEKARKEREKLEARAKVADEKGQLEKAVELLDRAEEVYVAPVTMATVGKGKSDTATAFSQDDLEIEVLDVRAFMAALLEAKSGALEVLFSINPAKLKSWAKSNNVKQFTGLRITPVSKARVR